MIFQSACCQESTQAARLTIGALAHAASLAKATARRSCFEIVDCTCKVKIFFLTDGNIIIIFSSRRIKDQSVSQHTLTFRRRFLREMSAADAGESESVLISIYGALGAAGHSLVDQSSLL